MQTRRRLFLSILRPVFLAALLTACVKVDQTLVLNPDGSGEFHVRYGMALENIAHMQDVSRQAASIEGFTDGKSDGSPFDFDEDSIREDFKAYEAHGVRLLDVKIRDEDGWKFVSLQIGFTNLESLARTEFVADRSIRITRLADGNVEFRQSAPAQGMNPSDLAGLDEASVKALMAEMMKGFQARMKVVAPTRIVETSADAHTDREATWSFDLDRDPNALDRAQKMDLRVVFEGQGVTMKEFRSGSESN